jgi:hypothetical protein
MPSLSFPLSSPLGPEAVGPNTRMMTALLPPGPWRRLVGVGVLFKLLEGAAAEIGRLGDRVVDLFREDDPRQAVELVPEYEADLDLSSLGSIEERRARVVARRLAWEQYLPSDIQASLASLLGQAAASVVVMERTPAMAIAMGDAREIFRFFIYRDPTLPGIYYLDSAQALLDTMSPSNTVGHVIESDTCCCDDPFSLVDRDLVGI